MIIIIHYVTLLLYYLLLSLIRTILVCYWATLKFQSTFRLSFSTRHWLQGRVIELWTSYCGTARMQSDEFRLKPRWWICQRGYYWFAVVMRRAGHSPRVRPLRGAIAATWNGAYAGASTRAGARGQRGQTSRCIVGTNRKYGALRSRPRSIRHDALRFKLKTD